MLDFANFVKSGLSDLNPKQAGLFADWYGRGRADSAPPIFNFCLNFPIDLKFGM